MSAKILIVDDESSARLTLENLLFSEGYTLQFAHDGPDGLARAREWQPDVILSDVMMPGMDGFEFCRRVRHDANLGQVPIILITAIADRQARLIGLQAGADEFVTKPIDSVELRTRLRTLTRLDRFRKLNDERLKLENVHRELVQAHTALRASDERFRSFVDQSTDGFLLTDEQGLIVDWNQALEQITGLSVAQALGKPLWDLQFQLNPIESQFKMPVERLKSISQKILQTGQSALLGRITDIEIQTADGTRKFIQQNVFATHTSGGHCIGAVLRDITEHKQLENQLEAESVRRRILFEESPDGILIIDPQTASLVEFNTTAHRQLGYSREEFAQLHIFDLEAHETATETLAHIAEVIQQGKGDFETLQRTKQGEIRNVHVTAQTVSILGQSVYYCTWRDITDRKRAEEARRESDERYHLLFQTMVQGVVFQDAAGYIIQANPAAERILGLTIDQMQGRTSVDPQWHAVHEDGSAFPGEAHPAMVALRTGQMVRSVVMGVFNPVQDTYRWINVNAVPRFLNGETQPYQVYTTFEDITERKQAETELSLTERRYRALIENAPDGVVLISADGKFTYASPSVERIFGYTHADLPDCDAVRMTHPDDLPRLLPELAALLAEPGRVPTLQYRFQHKNGGWRWIESTFSNLLALPSVESIIINFRDIHERKLAEEALHKSQALLTEAQRIGHIGHMEWNSREPALICSDELYDIFDLPRGTWVSQGTIADMMTPEDRERIERLDLQAIQQRTDMNYEYCIHLQDGRRRWLHQMGKVTYDDHGAPVRMLAIVQDVTQREQAEQALRETEFRQEMALRGANAGTWEWNVQTGEAIFNERWAQMIGYTLAELEPISIQTWITFCQPDDLKISNQLLQQHFAGETEYYECEARLKHKNGSWVWVIDRGRVMQWDAAGKPVRMFGTHLDITERKREENYTQSRLRLANLAYQRLDMISLMRAMLDEAEALTDSQIGFFHFVDDDQNTITLQAWSTNTLKTLCTAEGQGQHYPVAEAGVWAAGIRSGEPRIYNDYTALSNRRELPAGHAPVTRLISLPIKRNNKIVAALGVGNKSRDYTEHDLDIVQRLAEEAFDIILRKRAEEQLHASEEKYRSLLESLDSVIATFDLTGRVLFINEQGARALGRTPDQTVGQTMADIFPEPVAARQLGHIRQTILEDRSYVHQTESVVQGQPRWYRSSIQPIHDETGRAVQALINTTDITPIMTVQVQLEELNRSLEERVAQRTQELAAVNERLTELDKLKSKFVSDVSHELRTPVTSLSLYVDLLEHGKLEKRDYYVSKLKDQMGRLHKLINDILDLSRLERDQDEGNRSAVDINSIVEHVTATQLIAAEAAGLRLTCEVGENLPAVVARPDQLTRAITNLVSNAIKYTRTGSVRVQTAEQGNRVCIEVTDTGLGIAADELPNLFERFYRGRNVAQSSIPGTGLGLSIVKEIIESHGGTVEVRSELGQGSTFVIWLPVA